MRVFLSLLFSSALMTACGAKSSQNNQGAADANPAKGGLSAAYAANCKGCHGANGEGGFGKKLQHTDASLDEYTGIVRKGLNQMPAFDASKISNDDLRNDQSFLAALPN